MSSLGVGLIMELIRVFATTMRWSISIPKGRMQWAGFELVSKAMSRVEQSALRPICTPPPRATSCPNDMARPKIAVGRH
jgi:hypothetical protein